MQPFSDIPEDEWIECSTTFDRALSKLSIGQLVQDPRYSMMDLMSAIEVSHNCGTSHHVVDCELIPPVERRSMTREPIPTLPRRASGTVSSQTLMLAMF